VASVGDPWVLASRDRRAYARGPLEDGFERSEGRLNQQNLGDLVLWVPRGDLSNVPSAATLTWTFDARGCVILTAR